MSGTGCRPAKASEPPLGGAASSTNARSGSANTAEAIGTAHTAMQPAGMDPWLQHELQSFPSWRTVPSGQAEIVALLGPVPPGAAAYASIGP